MKASYNELPLRLQLMPDGHTKFRFEIEEITSNDSTQFECREVDIKGAVTADKVIEAAITDKWGNGVEQKLINDYNEFKLTGENPEAEAAYLEFLQLRKELKTHIKSLL